MATLERIKHNSVIFTALAVVFIFGAIMFTEKSVSPDNFQYQTHSFQKTLNAKEIEIDKIINEITDGIQDTTKSPFEVADIYTERLTLSDYIVLIYVDNYLSYWSNNSLPVYEFYHDNFFQSDIYKFQNAWYHISKSETNNYRIVGLIKIKNDFAYQNEFLKNEFQRDFSLPHGVSVQNEKGDYNVNDKDGNFVLSLGFNNGEYASEANYLILLCLYLIAYSFLIAAIYCAYNHILKRFAKKNLLLISFILDILIIRCIIFYFEIPDVLYSSVLFSPVYYASSSIFQSLGDMILNSITIFGIAYSVYKYGTKIKRKDRSSLLRKHMISTGILMYIFVLFIFFARHIESLVMNSIISFNLTDIANIDVYSLLGFLCMGLLMLSFVLLTFKVAQNLIILLKKRQTFFITVFVTSLAMYLLSMIFTELDIFYLIFLLIYIFSFWFIFRSESVNIQFSTILYQLVIFSFFSTYVLYQCTYEKEKEERKIIAQKLIQENNPLVEFIFDELSGEIQSDSVIGELLSRFQYVDELNLDSTTNYIAIRYFNKQWENYDILVTICDQTRELEIQPENYIVNCWEYFEDLIANYGKVTDNENLFYLEYDFTADNYVGIIDYTTDLNKFQIIIEIFSKYLPKGLGYPELLIDEETKRSAGWTEYNWARYENNKLVYNFGKYLYSFDLADYYSNGDEKIRFIDKNGYDHLVWTVDENTTLIISNKRADFLDIVAPFSYLLIFHGILLLVILTILRGPVDLKLFDLSFRKRLQLSITVLILASFLFIGIGSLFYIVSLNNDKNKDILSEKANSVLIELEHKLATENALTHDMDDYLSNLLYKFSLVFFSDINLYDLDGTLLASSRPELFNKGLLSIKMNTEAYKHLRNFNKSLYIHNECIGDYEYMSAYMPFRNDQNNLIAYLNLPYFAKQDELTNEIYTFLVAFVNVYVIFIAISVFIALIISNYITKPVQLIREKISRLKLGKTNEKIEWSKSDEIGSLVMEYNRMVDELAHSAELLAKSERESAWREMAKQIAHEIKNPLTPMKLSVQYLKKAWDDKTPGWDDRLQRFSQTIIEQIDSLSVIANEFSDFAKMPRSKFEKVELAEIISSSAGLFRDISNTTIRFDHSNEHYVRADKDQLLRVFNNLIKNSIQAIAKTRGGLIEILLSKENDSHIITIADNGEGIPEEQREKVFYPNFTTKSGGMGLGLAMVKNIIQNAGGEIVFESTSGEGTVFTITLPKYKE